MYYYSYSSHYFDTLQDAAMALIPSSVISPQVYRKLRDVSPGHDAAMVLIPSSVISPQVPSRSRDVSPGHDAAMALIPSSVIFPIVLLLLISHPAAADCSHHYFG